MVRPSETLEYELLRLPTADRARFAEVLLASLDDVGEDGSATREAVEAAWVAEGERRLAELRAGTVAGVSAATVFAGLPPRRHGDAAE